MRFQHVKDERDIIFSPDFHRAETSRAVENDTGPPPEIESFADLG